MAEDRYFSMIRRLAEYEAWCNGRLIEAAAGLSAEELYRRFGFGWGTVHATLFHTVEVLQMWGGCVGPAIGKGATRAYDVALSVEDMWRWHAEVAARFLLAVDGSHAAGILHEERRIVQVFHLITHGTHHRTQAITMLRLMGKDPPFEAGDFAGWERGLRQL